MQLDPEQSENYCPSRFEYVEPACRVEIYARDESEREWAHGIGWELGDLVGICREHRTGGSCSPKRPIRKAGTRATSQGSLALSLKTTTATSHRGHGLRASSPSAVCGSCCSPGTGRAITCSGSKPEGEDGRLTDRAAVTRETCERVLEGESMICLTRRRSMSSIRVPARDRACWVTPTENGAPIGLAEASGQPSSCGGDASGPVHPRPRSSRQRRPRALTPRAP
jgi:hypothetical protein